MRYTNRRILYFTLLYVFYLILVLVYKFLYLLQLLSCSRLFLTLHVYDYMISCVLSTMILNEYVML